MKSWMDQISEKPSGKHKKSVLNQVNPLLHARHLETSKINESKRFWVLTGIGSTFASILALVTFKKITKEERPPQEELLVKNTIVEMNIDTNEIEILTELDLIMELELMEEWNGESYG